MPTQNRPRTAALLSFAGTGAWTGLAVAALDVVVGMLQGRNVAADPGALLATAAALAFVASALWAILVAVAALRGVRPYAGTAVAVAGAALALFALVQPYPAPGRDGYPAAQMLFGAAASLAVCAVLYAWALHVRVAAPSAMRYAFHALGAGLWTGLLVAASVHLFRTQPSASADGSVSGPRHVYLIVVDTLRGDALSYAGYEGHETPHIDALAADSAVFRNALSQAPWTIPAMTSMLTGQSPLVHWCIHRWSVVPPSIPTLAERMAEAGYHTAAVGRNPVIGPHSGFARGFDRYEWDPPLQGGGPYGNLVASFLDSARYAWASPPPEKTTTALVDGAIEATRAYRQRPLFLWLHLFDPHLPYSPPAAWLGDAAPPTERFGRTLEFEDFERIRAGIVTPNAEERAWIRRLYDAEIRYVDDEIGRFIAHLKESGLYDDALIILTSDHGEEFWEHGAFEHGHSLYTELLHVPLLVKLPGNVATAAIDDVVSTTAVAPTILDLAGVPYDPESLSAESLTAHWRGGSLPVPPHYATGLLYYRDRESVIAEGLKYIYTFDGGWRELYDLGADPTERSNLAPEREEAARRMWSLIETLRSQAEALRLRNGIDDVDAPAALAPAQREALESVGYL